MAVKRVSIVVRDDATGESLQDLDIKLNEGYRVISTCPMPSAVHGTVSWYPPTCLVILQKP